MKKLFNSKNEIIVEKLDEDYIISKLENKSLSFDETLLIIKKSVNDKNSKIINHIIKTPMSTNDDDFLITHTFIESLLNPSSRLYVLFIPLLKENKNNLIYSFATTKSFFAKKDKESLLAIDCLFSNLKDVLFSKEHIVNTLNIFKMIVVNNNNKLLQVVLKHTPTPIPKPLISIFSYSAQTYQHEILKSLISHTTPNDFDKLLQLACFYYNPSNKDEPFIKNNQVKTINLLLNYANPKNNESTPLYLSCVSNNKAAIDILFPLSDVDLVEKNFKNKSRAGVSDVGINYFYSKVKTLNDKKALSSHVLDDKKLKNAKPKLI